ncbi:SDR family NAD(P)-dependent oxidoreductase [Kibdelosporangium phytohabitans]|uniref:SDR family NAD(P)-dependent oxidoreductase n=1 Tax=Kibdelosporangium phytohabitans TaxID=860235 RepID=UPI000A765AC4|nr:SDR family NAD(P)-dependent oxidoreductase [Kibdelosporangium phytohabitans]MBE1462838.1 NAD(P)-dependent dehydrogenase (short-subunit alcohol dehydrogenase family) [Kibdelosporangium phytohabitans]
MPKIVIIAGASSGFGAMTARALAGAGHTVYAGIRDIAGRNAVAAAEAKAYGDRVRPVEMDVSGQRSVDAAVAEVIADEGRLDVVVYNAGHMVLGAAEAFTPEQLASVYDTNVLSTQRLNRAALPHLRRQGDGLLVWVGSSSTRGGTPPFLAPYFAAKAAEDTLAVSYATEVSRFGIDTTVLVPGAFTRGTNQFANAGHAADEDVAAPMTSGTRASPRRWRVGSRPCCHRTPTPPRSRARSCAWSTCRRDSGRSACTSTRPRTEPNWSTRSATRSASSSTAGSATRSC